MTSVKLYDDICDITTTVKNGLNTLLKLMTSGKLYDDICDFIKPLTEVKKGSNTLPRHCDQW